MMYTQLELNALIEENQQKFEERERIVVGYEGTLCNIVLTMIVIVRMTVKEQRLRYDYKRTLKVISPGCGIGRYQFSRTK